MRWRSLCTISDFQKRATGSGASVKFVPRSIGIGTPRLVKIYKITASLLNFKHWVWSGPAIFLPSKPSLKTGVRFIEGCIPISFCGFNSAFILFWHIQQVNILRAISFVLYGTLSFAILRDSVYLGYHCYKPLGLSKLEMEWASVKYVTRSARIALSQKS